MLITRASTYDRTEPSSTGSTTTTSETTTRKTNRGKNFFLCREHYNASGKWTWDSSISSNCSSCIKYETKETLGNGTLPTGKEVMEYLITLRTKNNGLQVNNIHNCSVNLVLQWIFCTVYPHTVRAVDKCIQKMDDTFKKLKKSSSKKSISEKHWSDYLIFVEQQRSLFDIRGSSDRQKYQEHLWGAKMGTDEEQFYIKQKLVPRVGYCSTFVDRKWHLSNKRKVARANRSRNESYDDGLAGCSYEEADESGSPVKSTSDTSTHADYENDDYIPPSQKRRKYDYYEEFEEDQDPLPTKYRHPRDGLRSIRSEVYALMHYLSSSLHMSHEQVEGSIVAVANMLFDRKWKVFSKEEYGTDNNTLPSMSNTRRTERYMEAMALCNIVEEVMREDSESCVVYSNDGSSQSVTGNFVVQSLTVNGIQRSLPTFGIDTETKESLKDLTVSTLEILSAATGRKYTPKQILTKISFTMTDSTSHNVGVMDKVCEHFDIEEVPPQLFCNVHPLMLFQGKIKELCQQIHDHFGKQKIKECFLVDVDFQSESFVIKALKCLSNFINKECSGKPWNRSQHFSEFIKPKENVSICLKDHRFNRLNDCALTVLYHIDDIASYLDTFTSVTNGVAILDRGFLEVEILKPIFAAIAIVGLHITRPFHSLLMDKDTVYSTLLTAFPKLHEEMLTVDATDTLTTTTQVFFFVPKKIFELSRPKETLLASLQSYINEYPSEVAVLVKILLKMFADGFDHQKGAIFGFGKNSDKETEKNVAKICSMEKEKIAVLDRHVQTENIGEERNVGMAIYELSIRGKENLDSVSRKLVLKRSSDLIQENAASFRKYRKEAKAIKEIQLSWTEKMKVLRKKGFEEKDALNIKKDAAKLKDLEYLKTQQIAGPFTSSEDVEKFSASDHDEQQKQDRLYIEVRYAKATCLSMNTQALNKFFRLRRNGKKLESREYIDCLEKYLDTSKSVGHLTMSDLNNTLFDLQKSMLDSFSPISPSSDISVGEHVVVYWMVRDAPDWYLAIVDNVHDDGIDVLTLDPSPRKKKSEWAYPLNSRIYTVDFDQIIQRHVTVGYLATERIKCTIQADLVTEIDIQLKKITST